MAHTLDTSAVIAASTSNPVTEAYTCGAGATVLVLAIAVAGATDRAGGPPTYNGVALTQADSTRKYATSPEASAELWYLLDPPTGASYDVSIPNTGAKSVWGAVVTFKAQAGATTVLDSAKGNTGATANPSLSITPAAAGDVMVAILADGSSGVPTERGYTLLADQDWGQYVAAIQYGFEAGTYEVTMWHTIAADDWGMVMAAFKEESSIPGAPTDAHTDSKTDVRIVMHWTDNSNDETGFKMYRDDAYLETIAAGSVSYTFTGLSGGTTYDLAVKATSGGGDSAEAQLTETTNAEIGGTVYESNVTENGHGIAAYSWATMKQTFTPQISHVIYKVRLELQKNGSPSGDLTVSILDDSATSLCAAPSITMASVSTTATIYTFTFTTNPVLWAEMVYTIQIACTGGDNSNFIGIHVYYSAEIDIYPRGSAIEVDPITDWYFVECGEGCPIATIVWTPRTLPSSSSWESVTYGNGMFVAVAYGSAAASSPDGITWTARTMPSNSYWYSVAYGNGMFVAVTVGPSAVAASSPDGITWTARTLPSSSSWYFVAYGNGMFVAVAASSTVAASSPDGITWTARTLPSSSYWMSVAYGNGMFVAVAQGGSIAASSPDGITWTERAMPSSLDWYSVTYGDGMFMAVAYNGDVAASSPDGITWTERIMPSSSSWFSVTYGSGMFVAVAAVTAASLDGITWWTVGALPSGPNWRSVAYGNGAFVAVAYQSDAAASAGSVPAGITIVHSFPWVGRFQLTRVP